MNDCQMLSKLLLQLLLKSSSWSSSSKLLHSSMHYCSVVALVHQEWNQNTELVRRTKPKKAAFWVVKKLFFRNKNFLPRYTHCSLSLATQLIRSNSNRISIKVYFLKISTKKNLFLWDRRFHHVSSERPAPNHRNIHVLLIVNIN